MNLRASLIGKVHPGISNRTIGFSEHVERLFPWGRISSRRQTSSRPRLDVAVDSAPRAAIRIQHHEKEKEGHVGFHSPLVS